MSKRKRRLPYLLITLGLLLLSAAAGLVLYNVYDSFRARLASEAVISVIQIPDVPPQEPVESLSGEMPSVEVDGYDYIGRLEIESLGLSLPIMKEWSYRYLRVSPCRFSGSAYDGNLIIAAHNYQSHFGTIKSLSVGDIVSLTDTLGNTFRYTVTETENLKPNELDKLNAGDWDMTLFTCTIGGKTRVTVRLKLTED